MPISGHRGARSPSLHARVLLAVSAIGALVLGLASQSSARAVTSPTAGKTQVVQITIDVPALVVENLCNADTVNLHGQETITTSTTPTSNGGYRVVSSLQAHNLTGQRIAPLPAYGYKGDNVEDTYTYDAPPPNPVTTVSLLHWTKLVPQANAPNMWLVTVFRETITADGTAVPSVDRAYLTCTQPKSHDCHQTS
jgi:hypothetical protein